MTGEFDVRALITEAFVWTCSTRKMISIRTISNRMQIFGLKIFKNKRRDDRDVQRDSEQDVDMSAADQ
jgi:hypothetical protein